MPAALSGRKAQAAQNDEVILEAARAVFVADPGAPISAVAEKAGVGISALYRRYPSKEALLRKICGDGLRTYIEVAEACVADTGEPWEAFATFMTRVVDANTHALTLALAGTFEPTAELYEDAVRGDALNDEIVARAKAAGVLRHDLDVGDLAMIFEQLAAVRLGDDARTEGLRTRYLALTLEALRKSGGNLPGSPPTRAELGAKWG